MKIDEAIEIIQELPENLNHVLNGEQESALRLGIEALKRVKSTHRFHGMGDYIPLPGETE